MKRNNKKKGFTIVELVIVIAVIAILSAVLIPTFGSIIDQANESKAMQEVKNAHTATMAEDLSTAITTDDVVYGKDVTVLNNGYYVTITAEGEVSVAESGTATHTLENGLLKAN